MFDVINDVGNRYTEQKELFLENIEGELIQGGNHIKKPKVLVSDIFIW